MIEIDVDQVRWWQKHAKIHIIHVINANQKSYYALKSCGKLVSHDYCPFGFCIDFNFYLVFKCVL